ncbi:MAG: hypothetical protein ACRDPC_19805 [Solirubrobacteraceae bacterium]
MSTPVRKLGPLLLAAAALALPATASAAVEVGMSEQDPAMFSSPRFERLEARHARVVVGWDVLRNGWERMQLDAWLAAADAAGVRPLVSFSHSRRKGRSHVLPTKSAFRREVRAFRRAYPRVRDFVTWNEANHVSQPTHDRPGRAAAYFDVLDAACRGCRVAAADVLDDKKNLESWLRVFKRRAKRKPRIWGLHNYVDANRFEDEGTRRMLEAVKGRIWFTETGGLVRRYQRKRPGKRARWVRHSLRHAARATRYVLRLTELSPRVKRVYLYHWTPSSGTWDSALLDRRGRPRPAYHVVRSWLARR